MSEFKLWAQALDNAAPDDFEANGKLLSAEDEDARQSIVSEVSKVTRRGTLFFNERGVRLIADYRSFVLEIPSKERDVAGRVAPIVCHGPLASLNTETAFDDISSNVNHFSSKLGRSISEDQTKAIADAMEIIIKKVQKRSISRLAKILTSITALLMSIYLLLRRR